MRPADVDERRDPRQRSLLGASLRAVPDGSATACLVRNIGPGGARLALSDAVPLPELFDLTLTERHYTRRVRLVWRRADAVGVAFLPPSPPVPIA